MHSIVVLLAAALTMLLAGSLTPASAQQLGQLGSCGQRDQIVAAIKKHYFETRQSVGLAGSAGVIELYVSTKGTWTLLVTMPTGQTCIAGAGQGWKNVPEPMPEPAVQKKPEVET